MALWTGRVFSKVNQKVNLGRHPMPDVKRLYSFGNYCIQNGQNFHSVLAILNLSMVNTKGG